MFVSPTVKSGFKQRGNFRQVACSSMFCSCCWCCHCYPISPCGWQLTTGDGERYLMPNPNQITVPLSTVFCGGGPGGMDGHIQPLLSWSELDSSSEESCVQSQTFWRNKHLHSHYSLLWLLFQLLGLNSRLIFTPVFPTECSSDPQSDPLEE